MKIQFLLLLLFISIACHNNDTNKKIENKKKDTFHKDKSIPNWVGTYEGNIACYFCAEDMKITITLREDNTYTEHLEYDYLEFSRHKDYEGKINWSLDSTQIKIKPNNSKDSTFLKFNKNSLVIQLNDGSDRKELIDQYTIQKIN